jgi:hypothetical protein
MQLNKESADKDKDNDKLLLLVFGYCHILEKKHTEKLKIIPNAIVEYILMLLRQSMLTLNIIYKPDYGARPMGSFFPSVSVRNATIYFKPIELDHPEKLESMSNSIYQDITSHLNGQFAIDKCQFHQPSGYGFFNIRDEEESGILDDKLKIERYICKHYCLLFKKISFIEVPSMHSDSDSAKFLVSLSTKSA